MKFSVSWLSLILVFLVVTFASRADADDNVTGFAGAFAYTSDGRFEFSTRDGSHFYVSQDGQLDIRSIGKAVAPVFRKDSANRIIFAADETYKIIYVFRYSRGGQLVDIIDPQAKFSRLIYGTNNRVQAIVFPNHMQRKFP